MENENMENAVNTENTVSAEIGAEDMECMGKKKKGKAGIIAAVVLVLLIGAAAFLIARRLAVTPEEMVRQGYENMTEEMAEYSGIFAERIDFETIRERQETQTQHVNMDLSLTIPESGISNLSLSIDELASRSENKAQYGISAGMYGFQLSIAELVLSSDTLYLNVPLLFDNTYSVNLTNLAEDFNNSAWSGLLGVEIPEDYLDGQQSDELSELMDLISEDYADVQENAVYMKLSEKKDGCTGVRMTISKEDANAALELVCEDIIESGYYAELADSFGSAEDFDALTEELSSVRYETDFVMDYYFDKKGRIVYMQTPEDLELSNGGAFAVDLSFLGEDRALDKIEGGFYVKADDEIIYMGIERDASILNTVYNEDIALTFQADGSSSGAAVRFVGRFDGEDMSYDITLSLEAGGSAVLFEADGGFTDIVKGESYTLRVNNASLSVDGEELLYLSMVFESEFTDKELEIPDDAVDLLGLNEEEIYMLYMEAFGAFLSLDYE